MTNDFFKRIRSLTKIAVTKRALKNLERQLINFKNSVSSPYVNLGKSFNRSYNSTMRLIKNKYRKVKW